VKFTSKKATNHSEKYHTATKENNAVIFLCASATKTNLNLPCRSKLAAEIAVYGDFGREEIRPSYKKVYDEKKKKLTLVSRNRLRLRDLP